MALSFENLHCELLYRFEQVLASSGHNRSVALKSIQIAGGDTSLVHIGDALKEALTQHHARLPHTVAEAVQAFSRNVEPAIRAQNDADLVYSLIRYHERVQTGKLDALRQPKLPWAEVSGNEVLINPHYALDNRPDNPGNAEFTHPYRIEQFAEMLREAGAWNAAS